MSESWCVALKLVEQPNWNNPIIQKVRNCLPHLNDVWIRKFTLRYQDITFIKIKIKIIRVRKLCLSHFIKWKFANFFQWRFSIWIGSLWSYLSIFLKSNCYGTSNLNLFDRQQRSCIISFTFYTKIKSDRTKINTDSCFNFHWGKLKPNE